MDNVAPQVLGLMDINLNSSIAQLIQKLERTSKLYKSSVKYELFSGDRTWVW